MFGPKTQIIMLDRLHTRLFGTTPVRLVKPMVGRRPTTLQWDAGPLMLFPAGSL